MVYDHAVFAAEVAVEPARVIVDAVIRREQGSIDIVLRHPLAHITLAALHLGIGKGRIFLFTVVPFHHVQHVFRHFDAPIVQEHPTYRRELNEENLLT